MASNASQQTFDLAVRHHQSGRLGDAERLYREVLLQEPTHFLALHHLGIIAHQSGRNELAVDLLGQALAINPNWPEAFSNLGNILRESGKFEEAVAACRQAIALRPNYAQAHNNLGCALQAKGQFDEAIPILQQAIALKPDYAEAHNNLGSALKDKGDLDESIASHRRAIALNPNLAEAHHNLGIALQQQRRLDEAINSYRHAIALKPGYMKAHGNLATALQANQQLEEAVIANRAAIKIEPDIPSLHWNLAILLLSMGRFGEGWEEFEWRLKDETLRLGRAFATPRWNGELLAGKKLLLYTEGGHGDALQFIRYAPLLRDRAKQLILECDSALARLFSFLPDFEQIVVRGETLPAFDCQIPLQSLPRLFKTDLSKIPNSVPYLKAPLDDRVRWKARLQHERRLKVGLVWAGNPREHIRDEFRSRDLEVFSSLFQTPAVRFFSLQKGPASSLPRPEGFEITDFTADLIDFADTAALIENLDLVISVDTSVVHLAGALAKPVWVLIPFSSDFRWLLNRSDSPWYPTMRLFRQSAGGDWNSVLDRVAEALSLRVKNGQ